MDIAASIRMGLTKNNCKQADLANYLGKRRETISSWCNGHTTPTTSTLELIAKSFDVSVCEFIKWGE